MSRQESAHADVRARGRSVGRSRGRLVVLGPSPLLEVSIEPGPDTGHGVVPDTEPHIRVLPGGQAVWVARMAATMGAEVTMCGLLGGDTGELLLPMLQRQPFDCRLVATEAESGCFVVDQRHEPATEVASDWADPPSAEEVEALVVATVDESAGADVLVVCNPMPGDALPPEAYAELVASARTRGQTVIVDLSSPRLEAALAGGPAVVKLNDWELAELVAAPVDDPAGRSAAVRRVLDLGARAVVVTRGLSTVFACRAGGECVEMAPPRVGDGRAAGCGDAMTGALGAALAQGTPWLEAVSLGMAAGAAHYRGRGESSRAAIEGLAHEVSRAPARQ